MGNVFDVGVWVVFSLIVLYILFYWFGQPWIETKVDAIRKTWYTIYLFGALLYWASNKQSIFTNWTNYLIILIAFIIVDSFIFLSLYLRKVGNNEFENSSKTIKTVQHDLTENREKLENLSNTLAEHQFVQFTEDTEAYISELESLLNRYGAKEGLSVEIFPYESASEDEIKEFLSDTSKSRVERLLKQNKTYYNKDDKLMIYPVKLFEKQYIVKAVSNDNVTELDAIAFNILIMTFDIGMVEDEQL